MKTKLNKIKTQKKISSRIKLSSRLTKKRYSRDRNYDNTFINVYSYFPKEDDLKFGFLNNILKKYNITPNKYIETIRRNDEKLIRKARITDSSKITHLPKINVIALKLNPAFIFFNQIYPNLNGRYYNIPARLTNLLNRDKINVIENKANLYRSFLEFNRILSRKYLPQTFNIKDINKYDFTGERFYILKPVDSMGGVDIKYVSSIQDVKIAIEYYKTHRNYRNRFYGDNVIAQEYITKPLLYYKSPSGIVNHIDEFAGNGYKCHFRVPCVVSYINNIPSSFILEEGIRVLTALEPYNMNLPFTKEIHDTHIKSSGGDYFLLTDYKNLHITREKCDFIINEFRVVCGILEKILKKDNNKWLYAEHKNGFQIFGIDFMIEVNNGSGLNIKLIEVNNSPSFVFHDSNNSSRQSELLFKMLDNKIFSKLF